MDINIENAKILVIDDERIIRQSFTYYLEDHGFEVANAENGRIGIEKINSEKPSVILTDLRMPEGDGMEVLKHTRENFPEIPVIVISGVNRIDDAVQALRLGAWDYLIKPIQDLSLLGYTVDKALEKAVLMKENRAYKEHLEELVAVRTSMLEQRTRELEISRRQVIGILSQAAEYKDFETGNHFLRVSEISGCIAEGLGWSEAAVHNIKLASPVHDIGKIGIPDQILLKNGKLTAEEWEKMKEHCQYGNDILHSNKFVTTFCKLESETTPDCANSTDENCVIKIAANIALNHHEYWNGEGYPLGLKGEDIPIEARITAIADVYDALRSERPYKEPWPQKKCIEYISQRSDIQFDPEIVEVFLQKIERIKIILETYQN
ncbi:MAG: response regulator [Spirochaetales bacterium]|nr:response regulator [Spirochaetales bacterium]